MCGASGASQKVIGRRLNRSQGKRPSQLTGISVSVVKCNECDLVYPDPLPIPNSLEDHYDVDPNAYWRAEYFADDPNPFAGQIARFKKLSDISRPPVALDIGAGIGKCMTALDRAGFEAFGIEGSRSFFNAAIERGGQSVERLALATIESAEFEEASFDFITFGAVLEHLYDPSGSILKALEWTRPGGFIHLEVPSSGWLISRLGNMFYKISGSDFVANLSPMHPPYHLYEFGLRSFQAHADRYKYEIAHHEFYAAQTYLPRILDPVARYLMEKTNSGMQLEVWLRKSV